MSAKILPFTISNQNKIEATSTLRPQARWVKTVQIKSIQKIAKSIQKNRQKSPQFTFLEWMQTLLIIFGQISKITAKARLSRMNLRCNWIPPSIQSKSTYLRIHLAWFWAFWLFTGFPFMILRRLILVSRHVKYLTMFIKKCMKTSFM